MPPVPAKVVVGELELELDVAVNNLVYVALVEMVKDYLKRDMIVFGLYSMYFAAEVRGTGSVNWISDVKLLLTRTEASREGLLCTGLSTPSDGARSVPYLS